MILPLHLDYCRLAYPLDVALYILYNIGNKEVLIQCSNLKLSFMQKQTAMNRLKSLSLSWKMRVKMLRTIQILAQNGPLLREPYSKALDNDIFELRAKVGSDISRVLYFFILGRQIVLTNGFVKKSQNTPETEIERAKRYRKDFLARKEQAK